MRAHMTEITPQIVADHGLSPEEYDRVLAALGREPNLVELGIFFTILGAHAMSVARSFYY